MRYMASCVLLLGACSRERVDAPAAIASASSSSSVVAAPARPDASAAGLPCGALDCRLYDSPRDALLAALADKPIVVALGEGHAPRGNMRVESSAKRFTRDLLPLFKGLASDLEIELMVEPTGCGKQTAAVQKGIAPVVEQQRETNQNEYVQMRDAGRALGIASDLLHPSCQDLAAIAKVSDDVVKTLDLTLTTIARVTIAQAKARLALRARDGGDDGKMLLVYGGAFHGDPAPRDHRKPWSFAAALSEEVKGRYVSIHVFVPEFIENDYPTNEFAWFPHYDKSKHPDKVTLFRTGPQAFVMIFAAASR